MLEPVLADPGPELGPGRISLRQLVSAESGALDRMSGPMGWPVQPVGYVEPVEPTPLEVPLAVHPAICIPILQLPLNPLALLRVVELVVAVHDPPSVVGIVEIDNVIADEVA